MQKKMRKALTLHRETLAALDQGDLLALAGMSAATRLKNQYITEVATLCSCHFVNTHCIAG